MLCLDSGCNDYERLWVTTSLRGLAGGTLAVDILDEGVHSGAASGVVPSTFRIARQLLDRVEDATTGEIRLAELHVAIPDDRRRQAADTAADTPRYADRYPFVPGADPVVHDPVEQILNHTWRPTLSVVGADGLPPTTEAGNVLRPTTALQLSFRLPPTCDAEAALAAVAAALTADPPYGARVTFAGREAGPGWNAPAFAPWLEDVAAAGLARPPSAVRPGRSARAAPSRSWGCSASGSPTPSSSSPGCSGRTATPTAPTSTSTCRAPSGSPPRWPWCWTTTPAGSG